MQLTPATQSSEARTLVVAYIEAVDPWSAYLLGISRSAATPTIVLQLSDTATLVPSVPKEHGPRQISLGAIDTAGEILRTEIEIFEDEAIEIDKQEEISRYIEFLQEVSTPGHYGAEQRAVFINRYRDVYNVGQAAVVGNEATAREIKS